MKKQLTTVLIALTLFSTTLTAYAVSNDEVRQLTEKASGGDSVALNALKNTAAQGDATAQYNLGLMYEFGQGVAQDYAEAVSWYRKAANQGDADGQFNLGLMYDLGQGVAQDYAEAVSWYRKAANQGYATAQNNLGTMYEHGQGVAQNAVIAYALYNLSASNDPSQSNKALSNRQTISRLMTESQVKKGQELTRRMQTEVVVKAINNR